MTTVDPSDADAASPSTLRSAVLHLTDRMNGAPTYADAAETAEEVLHPEHGLLIRLQDFFEAAAEQANAFEDIDGWQLADRFTDSAGELGELTTDLADGADGLRALGPPTPSWQPDAAILRPTAAPHSSHRPPPEPSSVSNPSPTIRRTR